VAVSDTGSTVHPLRRRVRLVVLALVALVAVPAALGVVAQVLGDDGGDVVGLVLTDVVLVLACRALLRRGGRAQRLTLGAVPSPRTVGSCLGLAVASMGVACGTMWCTAVGLQTIAPEAAAFLFDADPLLATLTHASPAVATLIVFHVVLAGPILEEWLFRGVLLPVWSTRFGVLRAVAMTSMLFGVLHVDDPLGAAVFGWIAALLYLRSRSLWPPIVFHAAHNGLVTLFMLTGTESPTAAEMAAWWPTAAVATVLGAGVVSVWVRTGALGTSALASRGA
jgi:membrane protease YdiL (CAAX protease family)